MATFDKFTPIDETWYLEARQCLLETMMIQGDNFENDTLSWLISEATAEDGEVRKGKLRERWDKIVSWIQQVLSKIAKAFGTFWRNLVNMFTNREIQELERQISERDDVIKKLNNETISDLTDRLLEMEKKYSDLENLRNSDIERLMEEIERLRKNNQSFRDALRAANNILGDIQDAGITLTVPRSFDDYMDIQNEFEVGMFGRAGKRYTEGGIYGRFSELINDGGERLVKTTIERMKKSITVMIEYLNTPIKTKMSVKRIADIGTRLSNNLSDYEKVFSDGDVAETLKENADKHGDLFNNYLSVATEIMNTYQRICSKNREIASEFITIVEEYKRFLDYVLKALVTTERSK